MSPKKLLIVFGLFIGCVSTRRSLDNKIQRLKIPKNCSNHGRKFVHTKQQIELTKKPPLINVDSPCSGNQNIVIMILNAAHTSGRYYWRRQAIRETWATEARSDFNISVYFVLGLNRRQSMNVMIKNESEQYKDMIQFNFTDHQWNLTLKTLSILDWVHKHCPKIQYLLKAEDDVIINIPLLMKRLSTFDSGISGYLEPSTKLKQDNTTKCKFHRYVPHFLWPNKRLPKFLREGSYLLTKDALDKLLEGRDAYHGYVIDIEDVFITGILADAVGVDRYNRNKEFALSKMFKANGAQGVVFDSFNELQ